MVAHHCDHHHLVRLDIALIYDQCRGKRSISDLGIELLNDQFVRMSSKPDLHHFLVYLMDQAVGSRVRCARFFHTCSTCEQMVRCSGLVRLLGG